MRTIHPPGHGQQGAESCAIALEPAFAQLLERAEMAGWARDESLRALSLLIWRFVGPEAEADDAGRM